MSPATTAAATQATTRREEWGEQDLADRSQQKRRQQDHSVWRHFRLPARDGLCAKDPKEQVRGDRSIDTARKDDKAWD